MLTFKGNSAANNSMSQQALPVIVDSSGYIKFTKAATQTFPLHMNWEASLNDPNRRSDMIVT